MVEMQSVRRRYEVSEVNLESLPPSCESDREVLKPDFVFFGEGIPPMQPADPWRKSLGQIFF